MYGLWLQQVPSKQGRLHRDHITINGSRTREYDYSCLHIRLLYAYVGEALERDADAYEIDGVARGDAKAAVNILINAESQEKSIGALTWDKVVPDRGTAHQLIEAIHHKHKPIERFFHSGIGLQLMRIDSDIMMDVIESMLRKGVCLLPVHDSARVEERHFSDLEECMEIILEKELSRLGKGTNMVRVA